MGNGTTTHANGMEFGHIVCNGEQPRHRTEWFSGVIHVQSCNDHPCAGIGKGFANIHDALIKKLGFVNTHHMRPSCQLKDLAAMLNGSCG
jgi:hypothetical protein